MTKNCIECWKTFEPKNNKQICCSPECKKERDKKERKIRDAIPVEHVCEKCWEKFFWLKRRTLCDKCLMDKRVSNMQDYERVVMRKVCLTCWKEFDTESKTQKYCSQSCATRRHYLNITKQKKYNHVCCLCWKEFSNSQKDTNRCKECVHIKTDKQLLSSKNSFKKMLDIVKEIYNVDNPSQIPWVQEKKENTCFKNFWVRTPMQSKQVQEKFKQTNRERRWYDRPAQDPNVMNKIMEAIRKTNDERWYWPISNAELPHVQSNRWSKSKENKKLADELRQLWCEVKWLELCIKTDNNKNRYFDIELWNNVLLEYDPWNTHNTEYVLSRHSHYLNDKEKEEYKNKQLEKTILAEEKWYRCVHMFSWDDKDKIFDMVSTNKKRIYARECEVDIFTNISKPEKYKGVSELIESAHLQWQLSSRSVKIVTCISLSYKWEIVACMTFWPIRTINDPDTRECYRLCTKKWHLVIWWSQKMWKHFLKNIDPKHVVSFCDRAHFSWKVYRDLWMELTHIYEPRKVWCLGRIIPQREKYEQLYREYTWDYDFVFNRKELEKQRPFIQDNMMTWAWKVYFLWFDRVTKWLIWCRWKWTNNNDLAMLAWYVPVYDCWQMKFEWYKKP